MQRHAVTLLRPWCGASSPFQCALKYSASCVEHRCQRHLVCHPGQLLCHFLIHNSGRNSRGWSNKGCHGWKVLLLSCGVCQLRPEEVGGIFHFILVCRVIFSGDILCNNWSLLHGSALCNKTVMKCVEISNDFFYCQPNSEQYNNTSIYK